MAYKSRRGVVIGCRKLESGREYRSGTVIEILERVVGLESRLQARFCFLLSNCVELELGDGFKA